MHLVWSNLCPALKLGSNTSVWYVECLKLILWGHFHFSPFTRLLYLSTCLWEAGTTLSHTAETCSVHKYTHPLTQWCRWPPSLSLVVSEVICPLHVLGVFLSFPLLVRVFNGNFGLLGFLFIIREICALLYKVLWDAICCEYALYRWNLTEYSTCSFWQWLHFNSVEGDTACCYKRSNCLTFKSENLSNLLKHLLSHHLWIGLGTEFRYQTNPRMNFLNTGGSISFDMNYSANSAVKSKKKVAHFISSL